MTREEARLYIIRHCNPDYPKGKTEWERAVNMAIEALQQPEIVRCKDCRWHKPDINQCGRQVCAVMYGDDSCSYAEWINEEIEQEVLAWRELPEPWKEGETE